MTYTIKIEDRKQGDKKDLMIPAVMYGAHFKSTPIFINKKDFMKTFKSAGESTVVELDNNGKIENAMIHDVQMDPVMWEPVHADFYVVEKGQKVHVHVPLNFIGESFAVKNLGANLVKVMQELNVEADPTKLPKSIDVDISKLDNLDANIVASDLSLPEGVVLYHVSLTDVIASVVAQVEEDLSAPAAIDMSAIEVEKKGKKEDADAAAEAK